MSARIGGLRDGEKAVEFKYAIPLELYKSVLWYRSPKSPNPGTMNFFSFRY
jgi:hypothetical protein